MSHVANHYIPPSPTTLIPPTTLSSVEVQRNSGPEYVVYEPSQIGRIWVHSLCPGGGCLVLDERSNEIILGCDYTNDFADFGGVSDPTVQQRTALTLLIFGFFGANSFVRNMRDGTQLCAKHSKKAWHLSTSGVAQSIPTLLATHLFTPTHPRLFRRVAAATIKLTSVSSCACLLPPRTASALVLPKLLLALQSLRSPCV